MVYDVLAGRVQYTTIGSRNKGGNATKRDVPSPRAADQRSVPLATWAGYQFWNQAVNSPMSAVSP